VYVNLEKTRTQLFATLKNLPNEYKHLNKCFIDLAICANNGSNVVPQLKIATSTTITHDDYKMTIDRASDSLYRICFHANNSDLD